MPLIVRNKALNVGAGAGLVFRDESNLGQFNLKTIKAGTNVTVTNNADDIEIAAAGAAVGSLVYKSEFLPPAVWRPVYQLFSDSPLPAELQWIRGVNNNAYFSAHANEFLSDDNYAIATLYKLPYNLYVTGSELQIKFRFISDNADTANTLSWEIAARGLGTGDDPDGANFVNFNSFPLVGSGAGLVSGLVGGAINTGLVGNFAADNYLLITIIRRDDSHPGKAYFLGADVRTRITL